MVLKESDIIFQTINKFEAIEKAIESINSILTIECGYCAISANTESFVEEPEKQPFCLNCPVHQRNVQDSYFGLINALDKVSIYLSQILTFLLERKEFLDKIAAIETNLPNSAYEVDTNEWNN